MIDRYRTLLGRLAPHLSRQVRYVSIANEADVYFSAHPGELPAFLRFARLQIAELHRLAPWVGVGVTVTYDGLTSAQPYAARTLARLGDTTIATYYPLIDGYRMRSPRAPLHGIPQLVRLARGRPLVLQEVGYSSASRLHSSPSGQGAFVRNVFAAWNRLPRAIPFLSFYSLFDLPANDCRGRSGQETFLCSLGLHDRAGRPKPAWAAFRTGVQEERYDRRDLPAAGRIFTLRRRRQVWPQALVGPRLRPGLLTACIRMPTIVPVGWIKATTPRFVHPGHRSRVQAANPWDHGSHA